MPYLLNIVHPTLRFTKDGAPGEFVVVYCFLPSCCASPW